MYNDNFSYNPNFYFKDSTTWFKEFISLQDEVPYGILVKNEDSVFFKHRIIQVKVEKHNFIEKRGK